MDMLSELALKYKTDRWGKHHYTPIYYKLFKHKRNSVKKVLEIGVAEGAGLYMWRDFFPEAKIYGAEIDHQRVFSEYHIKVFLCDQSKEEHLLNLLSFTGVNLDFVVDDGSHKPEDQVFTALKILQVLKKGAIYVIEDVADPKIIERFDNFNCKMVECGKRYDDRLLIIRK